MIFSKRNFLLLYSVSALMIQLTASMDTSPNAEEMLDRMRSDNDLQLNLKRMNHLINRYEPGKDFFKDFVRESPNGDGVQFGGEFVGWTEDDIQEAEPLMAAISSRYTACAAPDYEPEFFMQLSENKERVGDLNFKNEWAGPEELRTAFLRKIARDEDLAAHAHRVSIRNQKSLPGMWAPLEWSKPTTEADKILKRFLANHKIEKIDGNDLPEEAKKLLMQYYKTENRVEDAFRRLARDSTYQPPADKDYKTWKLDQINHMHSSHNEDVLTRLIESDTHGDTKLHSHITGQRRKRGKSFQQQVDAYKRPRNSSVDVPSYTQAVNMFGDHDVKERFRGLKASSINDVNAAHERGVSNVGGFGISNISVTAPVAGETREHFAQRVAEENASEKRMDYGDFLARVPWDDNQQTMFGHFPIGKDTALARIGRLFQARLDHEDQVHPEEPWLNTARGRAFTKKREIEKIHTFVKPLFDMKFQDDVRQAKFTTVRRGGDTVRVDTLSSRRDNQDSDNLIAGMMGARALSMGGGGVDAKGNASGLPLMNSVYGAARKYAEVGELQEMARREAGKELDAKFAHHQKIELLNADEQMYEMKRTKAIEYLRFKAYGKTPDQMKHLHDHLLYIKAGDTVLTGIEKVGSGTDAETCKSLQAEWALEMLGDVENREGPKRDFVNQTHRTEITARGKAFIGKIEKFYAGLAAGVKKAADAEKRDAKFQEEQEAQRVKQAKALAARVAAEQEALGVDMTREEHLGAVVNYIKSLQKLKHGEIDPRFDTTKTLATIDHLKKQYAQVPQIIQMAAVSGQTADQFAHALALKAASQAPEKFI